MLPSAEFEPYWTNVIEQLKEPYDYICAYCCFRIHRVTGAASVDHMAPKSLSWDRNYEWDNYRLCSARLNARKNDFTDVIDPFEVKPPGCNGSAADGDSVLSTRLSCLKGCPFSNCQ
jgi:hypothetical protein